MIDSQSTIDSVLNEESADDLLSRGYARRDLARIAAIFGAGAVAAASGRPAWASAGVPDPAPTAKTRMDRTARTRPGGGGEDDRARQSLFPAR
jgi:histidinol-phosphate aminotransferase